MPHRNDRQLLFVALVVVGATGLAAGRLPGGDALGDTVGRALTPVQRSLSGAARLASGLLGRAREVDTVSARVEALEAENAALASQNTKLVDLIRENRALRRELDFARSRVDLDLAGASVVAMKVAEEPGSLRHTLKLNAGERDGVRQWMAVANHVGLIGQVIHTAPYWCDVLLITDSASMVQGRIERSRHTGIVTGSPTGELVMRYIAQDAGEADPAVQTGDLVYTSGLSQRFPPMLLIGQVTEVRQSDEQTHQEAVVRPAVSFGALEVALVIRDWLPAVADEAVSPGPDEAVSPSPAERDAP